MTLRHIKYSYWMLGWAPLELWRIITTFNFKNIDSWQYINFSSSFSKLWSTELIWKLKKLWEHFGRGLAKSCLRALQHSLHVCYHCPLGPVPNSVLQLPILAFPIPCLLQSRLEELPQNFPLLLLMRSTHKGWKHWVFSVLPRGLLSQALGQFQNTSQFQSQWEGQPQSYPVVWQSKCCQNL